MKKPGLGFAVLMGFKLTRINQRSAARAMHTAFRDWSGEGSTAGCNETLNQAHLADHQTGTMPVFYRSNETLLRNDSSFPGLSTLSTLSTGVSQPANHSETCLHGTQTVKKWLHSGYTNSTKQKAQP